MHACARGVPVLEKPNDRGQAALRSLLELQIGHREVLILTRVPGTILM